MLVKSAERTGLEGAENEPALWRGVWSGDRPRAFRANGWAWRLRRADRVVTLGRASCDAAADVERLVCDQGPSSVAPCFGLPPCRSRGAI